MIAPRYVQIQTQSQCNADCVFCPWVESWHAEHPGRMSQALWERILENLQPYADSLSRGMIAPYLMNEPLLDPRLPAWIEMIYAAFPKTMVQIATNGMALTQDRVELLLGVLDGRKHQIWVSHHGVDAASMTTLMRLDHRRAEERLLHLLRVADGAFRILIRGSGQSRDGRHSWFTPEQYKEHWAALFERHRINTRRVHVDAFTFHDRAGSLKRSDRGAAALCTGRVRTIDPHNPFWCTRIDEWLHVLWDGRIRICCMDYHGEVPLPSLQDMSIAQYLASEDYARLSARVRGETTTPSPFLCERCTSPGG